MIRRGKAKSFKSQILHNSLSVIVESWFTRTYESPFTSLYKNLLVLSYTLLAITNYKFQLQSGLSVESHATNNLLLKSDCVRTAF